MTMVNAGVANGREKFKNDVAATSTNSINSQLKSSVLKGGTISTMIASPPPPSVTPTQIRSNVPTASNPPTYKHITKILPKFAPSCSPSNPPSITSFQNPQIRFYTPINYFGSNVNPTATTTSSSTTATPTATPSSKVLMNQKVCMELISAIHSYINV